MKKSWNKQFFTCLVSFIFLLMSFWLSFAIFFRSQSKVTAANPLSTQPLPHTKSSADIYGYNPFNYSGSYSNIAAVADIDNNSYLAYKMHSGEKITYEHDLALSWFEANTASNTGTEKFFNFQFKVTDKNFTTIKLVLDIPSINASKSGKVSATIEIANTGLVTFNGSATNKSVDLTQDISLKLTKNTAINSYKVQLQSGTSTAEEIGVISNVDGFYTSYRVNNNITTMPLTLECIADNTQESTVLVKDLNGQGFMLENGNTIIDRANPVIVPTKSVVQFVNGTSFNSNFEYRQIDVLNATYAVVEYLGIDKTGESIADFKADSKNKLESKSDPIVLENTAQNANARAVITLQQKTTQTGSNGQLETVTKEYDIELKWYAKNSTISVVQPLNQTGAVYPSMQWDDAKIKSFTTNSITATGYTFNNNILQMPLGSGAYLYFGDLSTIVQNTLTVTGTTNSTYTVSMQDISYSIYYRIGENGEVKTVSATKNNQLRMPLDQPGNYQVVLVPEYQGLAMQVKNEVISTANVFRLAKDTANKALLPILNFEIAYSGPEANNGTSTVSGYVGTSFNSVNIEVIALDNEAYKSWKEYSLFELVTPNKELVTNEKVIAEMEKLRATTPNTTSLIADNKEDYDKTPNAYIGYLRKIEKFDERRGENEGDNIYKWNPDSGNYSFVPQNERFYIVQVEVTSTSAPQTSKFAFQAIDVLSRADINAGHDPSWVQKNMASIVLFSISGGLVLVLIGILVWPDKNKRAKKRLIGADLLKDAANSVDLQVDNADLNTKNDIVNIDKKKE